MSPRTRPGSKRTSLRERRVARVGRRQPSSVSDREITLVDTLDRVLDRGVVVHGEVVISVAEIPLIYVGLQALVSSVETASAALGSRETKQNTTSPANPEKPEELLQRGTETVDGPADGRLPDRT